MLTTLLVVRTNLTAVMLELARTCTQLALKTGDLATAQARAEEWTCSPPVIPG